MARTVAPSNASRTEGMGRMKIHVKLPHQGGVLLASSGIFLDEVDAVLADNAEMIRSQNIAPDDLLEEDLAAGFTQGDSE